MYISIVVDTGYVVNYKKRRFLPRHLQILSFMGLIVKNKNNRRFFVQKSLLINTCIQKIDSFFKKTIFPGIASHSIFVINSVDVNNEYVRITEIVIFKAMQIEKCMDAIDMDHIIFNFSWEGSSTFEEKAVFWNGVWLIFLR